MRIIHRSKNLKENIFQTNSLFTYSIPLVAAFYPMKAVLAFLPPSDIQLSQWHSKHFCLGPANDEHCVFKIYINFNLVLNYHISLPPCQAHTQSPPADQCGLPVASMLESLLDGKEILPVHRHKTHHFYLIRSMFVTAGKKKGFFPCIFFLGIYRWADQQSNIVYQRKFWPELHSFAIQTHCFLLWQSLETWRYIIAWYRNICL